MKEIQKIGILALLGAFAIGCGAAEKAADDDAAKGPVSVKMAEAAKRDVRSTVAIQGTFVPAQGASAKLGPSGPGRISQVLVHEGDEVKPGQLLAVVSNEVQAAQARSAEQGARSAQAQADTASFTAHQAQADRSLGLKTAQLALESARIEARSDINQRKADLGSAVADLSRLKEGARPQEKAQARQNVVQAEIVQRRAAQEYRRSQSLAAEGYVSKRDLADAKANFDNANSALESARQAESLLLAGARPQELKVAELKVAAARDAYESAQVIDAKKVALAEAAVRQAEHSALTVQARLSDAKASQANARQKDADFAAAKAGSSLMEVRSPIAGRVTHRYLNPGEPTDTTLPIVEVTGSGKVDFVGSAPATDAISIKKGMAVEIGGATGVVTSVSAGDPTTGLATIRVATSAQAAPGSFATGLVVTETHAGAIAVPSDAVVDREGKSVIYVVDGDSVKQTEVEEGAEDAGFTEITKGIKLGQKVVVLGQSELADGAKVKQAEDKPDEKKDQGEAK